MQEALELDEIARLVQQYVTNTSRHVFLTGKAGTGKTTLLKHVLSKTHKKTVIAAPTGIAAINAGGVTLHSLFQLPFGTYVPDNFTLPFDELNQKIHTPASLMKEQRLNASKRQLIREMELLIIDEVSMLRADLLDAIDLVLKKIRKQPGRAFGGVQVLFIGDLYQLPPVVKRDEMKLLYEFYQSLYFFDALVLRDDPLVAFELDTVHRQSDPVFIGLLNRIREQSLTEEDQYLLQEHYAQDGYIPEDEGHIHLTTHNARAAAINEERLNRLPGKTYSFSAEINGRFEPHQYPNEEKLVLKKGAQVMFIKNDPTGQQRFFNGKIGTVSDISTAGITVDTGTETIKLERYLWENKRFKVDPGTREINEERIGEFAQYPIKLAWAVTVHKSQGLTFEKAILDLEGAFAPGQFYVAMSRLVSLEGLVFSSPVPRNSFAIDPALQQFTEKLTITDQLYDQLLRDQRSYLLDLCTRAFDFEPMLHSFLEMKKAMRQSGSTATDDPVWTIIRDWGDTLSGWAGIGRSFANELFKIGTLAEDQYLPRLTQRISDGSGYFIPKLLEIIQTLLKTGGKKPYKKDKEFQSVWRSWHQEISDKALQILRVRILIRVTTLDDTDYQAALKQDPDYLAISQPYKQATKTDTKAETFDLYKSGMTAEEIADRRELTVGTIINHLVHYIRKGQVQATDLISKEKLENILTVAEKIKSHNLTDIKSRLGDEYSYEDIRIAMAHLTARESHG